MRLSGKRAIVGGGFGGVIARLYAAEATDMVVADMNETQAEPVASKIGGRAVRVDVSLGSDIDSIVRSALDRYAGLDIVVTNAGIRPQPGLVWDTAGMGAGHMITWCMATALLVDGGRCA